MALLHAVCVTTIDQSPGDWPVLFRRWNRSILDQDLEAFRDLLSADVRVGLADGSMAHGPDAWIGILGWMYRLLGVGGQTVDKWFTDGAGTYGWQWRHAGKTAAGRDFDIRGCTICELHDGLVRRIDSYADTAQLARLTS